MKGRIAWAIVPHLSGMMTAYASLSAGLRDRGWEVYPVWAGKMPPLQAGGGMDAHVTMLAPESADPIESAVAFVRWVADRRIDILVRTGESFALASIPALPAGTRVVAKCPNQSRHSYRLVTACLARTDLIVAETRRQYEDLTKGWHVPAARCALIPNGVQTDIFRPPPARNFSGPLRLVFVGRLDEATKHVMLLPKVGRVLAERGVAFEMTVIGDGPDRRRLERQIEAFGLSSQVQVIGSVSRAQLPQLLREAHVAVVPSRLDGLSWALLEAMACGCVPVASRIGGTTDMVIRDGGNGFLCRVGDARAFARPIAKLAGDRTLLQKMSLLSRQVIEAGFSSGRTIDAHDRAFTQLLQRQQAHARPVPLAEIGPPKILQPSWRSHIPRPIKNSVRTWAQRFGVTL